MKLVPVSFYILMVSYIVGCDNTGTDENTAAPLSFIALGELFNLRHQAIDPSEKEIIDAQTHY